MKNLDETRKDIDNIDKQLLELLSLRAEKVKEIFEVKKDEKLPPFDPAREKRIIENLVKVNKGLLKEKDIETIMESIFKVYRGMFRQIKVAYFGPEGTFTQQAAIKQFGEKVEYIPCRTIDNVFKEVEHNRADYGIVPVENSIEGVVTHTLDMFVDSNLKIVSEVILDVHHFFLSKEDSIKNVKKIFSHPQPISQCWNWITTNLPNIEIVEAESTSKAVQLASNEKETAAIGAKVAASIYKMNILAENIEDYTGNVTRFLVVGKKLSSKTETDQTSIILSIKDKIGALQDILNHFTKSNINLTRIESRPSKKKAWDYIFYLDFIGHKEDNKIKSVLTELEKETVFLKVLGSYPAKDTNKT
ncbi:prephenate dehydratase [bacterium]|nr:prephenate dehydratase [bacterium]